ncbi:hypothetical protein NDU88_004333 [Pleurodeles waltl]|uniref:Uncharacterized protein n=1 Tax=Pleurodeles waltl TaxID=8319 RepID=A0AAV7RHU6_PLEWA|nr:hypothetical protein NDU88_004333 [Pleurodeles waltl]
MRGAQGPLSLVVPPGKEPEVLGVGRGAARTVLLPSPATCSHHRLAYQHINSPTHRHSSKQRAHAPPRPPPLTECLSSSAGRISRTWRRGGAQQRKLVWRKAHGAPTERQRQ